MNMNFFLSNIYFLFPSYDSGIHLILSAMKTWYIKYIKGQVWSNEEILILPSTVWWFLPENSSLKRFSGLSSAT